LWRAWWREEYVKNFDGEVLDQNTTWKKRTYVGDNNGIGLQETGLDIVSWINLAQDRDDLLAVVNTVLNFRVHKKRRLSDYLKLFLIQKKDSAPWN
jgi:hypothetical protein